MLGVVFASAIAALVAVPSTGWTSSPNPTVATPTVRPMLRVSSDRSARMSATGGALEGPSPPPAPEASSTQLSPASAVSIATVLLSTFLNLLGFTMTLPINVALRAHFGLSMGASFGSLSSAYPLGQFGALFLWPRLSDRVGRRPVMALSLVGTGMGLALQV